jgi:mono/diheme cytochrome c family protein
MQKKSLTALVGAIGAACLVAGGMVVTTAQAEPLQVAQADAAPDMATLMAEGEPLFNSNCAGCHGRDGLGDTAGLPGPKLVANEFLASAGAIIGQIMVGNPNHGMPPFAHLSDREIAAIGTYVRNSWGNAYGIVPVNSVTIRRPE